MLARSSRGPATLKRSLRPATTRSDPLRPGDHPDFVATRERGTCCGPRSLHAKMKPAVEVSGCILKARGALDWLIGAGKRDPLAQAARRLGAPRQEAHLGANRRDGSKWFDTTLLATAHSLKAAAPAP